MLCQTVYHQNEKNVDMLMKQRDTMKFWMRLNKTKMIVLLWEAFGENTLHESTLWRWYRAQELVDLQPYSGKLKMVATRHNIDTIVAVIAEDHSSSIWTLSALLHISRIPLQRILTETTGLKICFRTFLLWLFQRGWCNHVCINGCILACVSHMEFVLGSFES